MKDQNTRSTFEDLDVYKVAREFRKQMYRVAKALPEIEKFALANQIRRAAVSLTNNIAEGHGRFHYLDQVKFTLQSRGSLEELIDDLNICEDQEYCSEAEIASLKKEGWRLRQLIDGYIRYLRAQKDPEHVLSAREDAEEYGDTDDGEIDSRISIHESRFNDCP